MKAKVITTSLETMASRLAAGDISLNSDRVVMRILRNALGRLYEVDVYRHENGFAKINLGIHSRTQIRVHIWDTELELSATNIHSHRHPIVSRVVAGAFDEQRWLPKATGRIFRCYDFSPGVPGDMELVEHGTIRLQSEPVRTRMSGETYSIPLGEFHTVRPLRGPTITVFTQDLRSRSEGMVASEGRISTLTRPSLMRDRDRWPLRDILSQQISALAESPGPPPQEEWGA